MEGILAFWLPILLAAVFVFVVSSVIHMALPIHKNDYKKVPNEEKLLESIRAQGVGPGNYVFPHAGSMKEMGTPEMKEKYKRGPVGFFTLMPPGECNIGKSLIQWFLLSVLIGVFVAYIASVGLPRGADPMAIFRMTTTIALLGYGIAQFCDSIWKGVSWSVTLKFFFDGLLYSLATGAAFAWFWPAAGQ